MMYCSFRLLQTPIELTLPSTQHTVRIYTPPLKKIHISTDSLKIKKVVEIYLIGRRIHVKQPTVIYYYVYRTSSG